MVAELNREGRRRRQRDPVPPLPEPRSPDPRPIRIEVDRVTDSVDRLLDELPPGEALEAWVTELARYAMTKHGFAEALQAATAPGSELFTETYARIVASLAKLLKAAADDGVLREGLDPDDVILAFAGLWQLDPNSDWLARAQRLYQLVVNGLQT